MKPQHNHSLPPWMDSLEQILKGSEGFEGFAGLNARSLVIKFIFKLMIKIRFSEAPEYMVQLELWLL